ncbi:MAG TPA: PKD domain-containing protein [Tepidisphaeraceae bacterium]|jgi:hypothetical protein|nr:PKD domain-containing protein [Tepidisphaeraceae bacterium]
MKIVDFIPRQSPSAVKILRAAVERPVQDLIERLEARQLFSVALNAAGFTVVTPSPDSDLIYVSAAGSDANTGLSPNTPVASFAKAYSLMRNGYPDWILLKRGDTFTDSFSNFADSGRSQQEPAVITDYGDPALPRPVVDAGANIALRMSTFNQHVDVIGIAFTSSTHDPTSPNFTGQGNYGFYDLGGTSDLLIEDCSFSYFLVDINLQGFYSPLYNITVRRDQILDSYSTVGHSQGLYAESVNGLTIDDSVFDHDGWNTSVPGAGATIFNHDAYLHSSNNGVVVTNNIFADAASFGLQARSGGIVDDNAFINDPYAFSFGLVNGATTRAGGVSGEVIGNVVLGSRQDASGWGIGAMIGNLAVGGDTVISDNLFADGGGTQPAILFQPGSNVSNPQQEVGLNSLVLSDNIVYNWGFGLSITSQFDSGGTGADGLTSVVVRDNDFQDNVTGRLVSHGAQYDPRYEDWSGNVYSSTTAPTSSWFSLQGPLMSFATWQNNIEPTAVNAVVPFVDPTRTAATYMASQGMTATLAAFIAGARTLSATNWNPVYLASTIASYVQGGFIVDSDAPTAVAAPPPDITAINYLTTPNPTFTVTYADAVAVNPATLSSGNLSITGAGGMTIRVTLVGTAGAGASIVATYQLSAPNNDWTTVPNGTFVISLAGGQVGDMAGNIAPAQPLGSFRVTVNTDPGAAIAPATTPDSLTAVAGASSVALSWTDSAGDQRSYLLQRALDANFTQQVQSFPLTADALGYIDPSVAAGVTYYYQLIAVNPLGASLPTAAASAVILPPAPVLGGVIFNDNNAQRTAITSATLYFTQPVTVDPTMLTLIQNPTTTAVPIATTAANPTEDGKTWIVTWATAQFDDALADGKYSLTVHGGLIADAFGQTAGADVTKTFTSADGPVVTAASYSHAAPPHKLSFTFSEDVSASLSLSDLKVLNSSNVAVSAVSYKWNAATLTATYTFAGALADGSYTARLSASGISNADGVELDGGQTGIPGVDYVYSFTEVKPTLTISGAANANFAVPYTLTLGAITDAGQTSPSYLVHWGDGSTSAYAAAGKVTHSYLSAIGSTTISVDVIDLNGTHTAAATLSTSINRPSIVISGGANANPQSAYTLTLGAVTDTGFTVSKYIVHWGDGSSTTYTSAGAVQHTYGAITAAKSTAITVDLVDNSGVSGASFTNVSVATLPLTLNVYPSIPVSGALNANAGGSYRLTLGKPIDNGFTVKQLSINWGDGSTPDVVPAGTTVFTHTFASNAPLGSDAISVGIIDTGGTFAGAGVQNITINPSPTVVVTGAANANAGGAYALHVAPAADIGQTVLGYTINWGDGSSSPESAPGDYIHTYTTAASVNVTVDVADATGTFYAAGSLAVQVNNGPTVPLVGNPYANVGGLYTLNFGAISDPGQIVYQYTVNWGDGTKNTTPLTGSAIPSITHVYATAPQANITVDLYDATGVFYGAGSLPVTAAKPAVSLEGSSTVFQGQSYSLTVDPAADLGGTPLAYVIHWGDGSTESHTTAGVFDHTYAMPLQTSITADLVDTTGTFAGIATLPVLVAASPVVSLVGATNTNVGVNYTLNVGTPTDQIGPVTSMTVNWGDNSSTVIAGAQSLTHLYTTLGPAVISVDITSGNQTWLSAAALALNVNQPTLAVNGNAMVNQGQHYALTLGSVSDPGQTITGYTVHWGDGNDSIYTSGGIAYHSYASVGANSITVDMTDGIGTYVAIASQSVQVNSYPVVTLAGNPDANAGGQYTLNLAGVTDSSGSPGGYTVNWGDGLSSAYGASGPFYHEYTSAGPETITIDVNDPAGTSTNVGSLPITVNPSPTVSLTGSGANANVGGTYTLNLGAVSDPGYSVSHYVINWGDGQPSAIPLSGPTAPGASGSGYGSVTHTYQTTGARTISVSLADDTGIYTAATLPLNVNQPTVPVTGNQTATKGQSYALTLGAPFDPGQTVTGYTVHWGDGASNVYTSNGIVQHTYGAAGSDMITVDMSDGVGAYASVASRTVQVSGAGPVVTLSGSAHANAGGTYTLNVAKVVDPNGKATKYTVHWGDGATTTSASAGPFTHTFSSAGATNISIDVTDSAGTFTGAGTLPVTVNPAPTVSVAASKFTANVGGVYTLNLGAISDPGYTVSRYVIAWGDGKSTTVSIGSATAAGATGAGYGAVTHTYAAIGAENITVSMTDATGTYTGAKLPIYVDWAPTAALAGSAMATAHSSYTLTVDPAVDHGSTVSSYTIHWGDGQTTVSKTPGAFTHTYTTAATETISLDLTDPTGTYVKVATAAVAVHAAVVTRATFYNDSAFNGYKTTASTADFAAVATDKQALLPGNTATFKNLTSYTNGINGIIVDVAGLPAGTKLSAKDFSFATGNTSTPSTWTTHPAPSGVTVFRGAGANGSDRIVITFANKAILGRWLKVSVLPTAYTGLASADVFYFGNAPGYSGANPATAMVSSTDVAVTKSHASSTKALITNNYDFNRDGLVNSTDASAALADQTTASTMLKFISV